MEVDALDSIFRKWNIPYKGNNNDGESWNINSTNPCKGFVVSDTNNESVEDSVRGKLQILCLCDGDTSICNIIKLAVWDLDIYGTILNELQNLTKLVYLDITSNYLSGELPAFLWILSDMKIMYFSGNNFNGILPPEIGNLKNIKYLYLSRNNFNGSLPSEVENLKNIEALYLKQNNFNGSLPPEIGNLKKIQELDISKNKFGGNIPRSFWNLTNLEKLFINNNNFNGSLPEEIENLKNLTTLDLSENNFTGSIPNILRQRQSQGLLNMSIEGNPGLCFDCGRSSSNKTMIFIIAVVCSIIAALTVIIFVIWKVKRNSRNLTSFGTLSKEPIHAANKEFTYLELVTMTSNFNKIIGKGGFGNVYYGIDQRNGSEVAVKMLSSSSAQGSKEFQIEASALNIPSTL